MREKPALADELIIEAVRTAYHIRVTSLEFLPIGYDENACVYRAAAADGIDYFLKVKKGGIAETSLAVPHFLQGSGIAQIVAPLPTSDGQLHATIEPFALILYPFIPSRTAMEIGLSEHQWSEFGTILQQMHAAPLPPDLASQLPRENFISKTLGLIPEVDAKVQSSTFTDPLQREMAEFWKHQRTTIFAILERSEVLARELQERSLPFVLCHADIHTANVLIDPQGALWIVDWDDAMLAPKERDLMFVTGSDALNTIKGGEAAQTAFFRGYGSADEIDPLAMAYYRCDWVVQDVGLYGADMFLKDEISEETQIDVARILRGMFASGNTVEAAQRSL